MTVTGETLGERLAHEATAWVDRAIIAEREKPVEPQGGLVALFGKLAPHGAILKRSAADASCSSTRAARWCSRRSRILPRASTIRSSTSTPKDILVLQNAGPHPRSAHAGGRLSADSEEARARRRQGHGAHLRRAHERHRLRHDRAARDARRASGGPLGLVRNGDRIRLSVKQRRIDLLVDDAELKRRAAAAKRDGRAPRAAMPGCTPRKSSAPIRAAISPS